MKIYVNGKETSFKPRKYDIARGLWALLWVIPFVVTYMLLMAIAFVGFGKSVAKDTVKDFK